MSVGNWERQQEVRQATRERERIGRETLGKFFYDLAKLTFATMVLGGMVSVITDFSKINYWTLMASGFVFTFALAYLGRRILK